MPSNFTQNYQLSQWEATDQVCRTDFNSDNAKIDAAIKAVDAKFDAAVAGLQAGQLRLVTGSYVGAGKYGPNNPNTLTFPFQPKIVGIAANVGDPYVSGTLFIYGQSQSTGFGAPGNIRLQLSVSWTGNSVSWFTSSADTSYQLNVSGYTYFYFALG